MTGWWTFWTWIGVLFVSYELSHIIGLLEKIVEGMPK